MSDQRPLALVVDDEAAVRLLAREVLEHSGLTVVEAHDGAAGLAALDAARPDLVLLDVQMPGKDGFATCRELRARPAGRHVPVLMMTGLDDVESIDRAYQSGATDFITKPVNRPILGHRVRYILRAGRSFEALRQQEEKLARLSRVQAVLSGINSALVRIHDRARLFEEVCRIAVEHGSFTMAWVGLVEPGAMYARPEAWAGREQGYLRAVERSVREVPDGEGAGKLVVLSGEPLVVNRIETDPRVVYKAEALSRGYQSLVILPLRVEDRVAGLIGLYAREPDLFNDEEMRLLNELAADVSFGLDYLAKQERLDYLAYYDVLTGLPNRSLFCDRVNQQLGAARHDGRKLAVVHVELERFRDIRHTLGHAAGDALLKMAAERLGGALCEPDLLARSGPDGFALALLSIKAESDAVHVLERRLANALERPFALAGTELRVAAKSGIALFPADGSDADTLLANAATAFKKAEASAEPHAFYTAHMNRRVAEKLFLEARLARALEKRQFVLHYQPKVELASGRISGLEALIRWQDPESGLVPPGIFIPVLEETGLILEVGKWAIGMALADHRRWTAAGLRPPRIAVNVSPFQLRRADFVSDVRSLLEAQRAGAGALDLEITETLVMENIEDSIPKLTALRAMDVAIAIDDFGTGYSSLSYVTKLPVDVLKIDRAFVADMATSVESKAVVSAIIALSHALGLEVVAEGVEIEEQAGLLRAMRCDQMQGYLYSPPLPQAGIGAMLARETARLRLPA